MDSQGNPTGKHPRNNVPFLENGNLDCGPVSLAMVASNFGLNVPLQRIQQLVSAETSGVTWTLGIAAAAAELGLAVRMYSLNFGVNQNNFNLEYYREHAAGLSESQQKLASLSRRCIAAGAALEERSLSLQELCDSVRAGSVPIVLLDWGKVINHPSYIGHFVPVVGFSPSEILVHNPGPRDPAPFMAINREIFEAARKAHGTDEDVVIVDGSRKA